VGLCSPCLRWRGRLCRRQCAAGGCARAVLMWGGVSRGYTIIKGGNRCRDGEYTYTPKRYRLELNSAHTFDRRKDSRDPHTVWSYIFGDKHRNNRRGHELGLGLYTILLLPIWYGVCHTKGGSVGGRILPNSRAIILKQCGQCRHAGRMQGRLLRAQITRSKTVSCKGQAGT